VNCVAYTEQDGLPDLETNGQISYPPVIQLRDGRVAFATVAGVALFDPAAPPDLTNGPPVHLDSLRVGARALDPTRTTGRVLTTTRGTASGQVAPRPVRIRPEDRGLVDLRYTAISFRSPDQTRFRYRLLGLSPEWVDAGGLRQATYANLRPGAYTFEVMAANHHGHWSAQPARLDLLVEPRWHERLTVRLAGALALFAAVVGVVRWRLEQLRRLAHLEHQAALARHRARLAKDLHDGLGANLTEITLLTGIGEAPNLPPDDLARRFNRLTRTTHEALHALRDIIWSTTPKADSLEALVSRLCESTERATEAAGLRCRFQFPPELPAVVLGPELRKDLLFAVNEVIHNVIRHAHATEVRMRFRIEDRWLEIEIEDDGQGFAVAEVAQRRAAPDRGLGLPSVCERVMAHSGVCELRSQPGHGTKITLRVPLLAPHLR
jgi:signal transduction histidine kinase